ncbi:thiol-disulfide oxidoreductase DCC family protein [Sagittula salina]|uniref:DUF393 domain-containing protein n=1 Tax=Sagittula salina TaxID=2820268 RepID=A0A940MFY3_9RHOB|nr:DCC1-like thiol-disulfide oxidoreductase family protein [Sagittula salina]MBP0480940.1 DUF393 domain-containing protein [Sagittula salina]
MNPGKRQAYSWRNDPSVPVFDDARLVVVLDGDCALCSVTARWIARLDRGDVVRLCVAQGLLGRALMAHHGMAPEDPQSWLLLENGRAHGGLEAMRVLFPRLHPAFLPLHLLRLLPHCVRDGIYARIARNRYRLGQADLCALPDEGVRHRLIG